LQWRADLLIVAAGERLGDDDLAGTAFLVAALRTAVATVRPKPPARFHAGHQVMRKGMALSHASMAAVKRSYSVCVRACVRVCGWIANNHKGATDRHRVDCSPRRGRNGSQRRTRRPSFARDASDTAGVAEHL